MPVSYFFYLAILLVTLFLLTRYFFLKRNSLSTKLFIKALKAENNGHFEEATVLYEDALTEVKKVRFHLILKKKITEKLKVLLTVKQYTNCQGFIRKDDSWLAS